MGQMGSDIALESSDIVFMHDDLNQIKSAFNVSKRTRMIVYQNIVIAILIKVLFLSLGAFGVIFHVRSCIRRRWCCDTSYSECFKNNL